jgi:hypothetical protein
LLKKAIDQAIGRLEIINPLFQCQGRSERRSAVLRFFAGGGQLGLVFSSAGYAELLGFALSCASAMVR